MFDNGLEDVEELERLEELKKFGEVERTTIDASGYNDFFSSSTFSLGTLE